VKEKNVRENIFRKIFEKNNPPEKKCGGSSTFPGWDSHPTPPIAEITAPPHYALALMKFNAAEIAQRWRHQMFVKKKIREKKFRKKNRNN
jgi:hypothetical protein